MSRIGKLPIEIPAGVTAEIKGNDVVVKGPKGELTSSFSPDIAIKQEDNNMVFEIKRDGKHAKALWGLTRALVANMIEGVTEGFEKKLELVGVGYRVKASGNGVTLSLGYSHPIEFQKPEGIEIAVEDNKTLKISGIDKQLVGQTAAKLRSLRKPEPYKGKGVRYVGEVVRTKPGKAGKV